MHGPVGGFAHVYLVRTAVPVYNTTHHVLKRIAVANDAMLTEVKKEVDIMVRPPKTSAQETILMIAQRILKGHPNIVHLIDAAWHRMPNGMYEVFILMEFCAGKHFFLFIPLYLPIPPNLLQAAE